MSRLKPILLSELAGEVVISTPTTRNAIHRAARAGKLRKLAPRIYSGNFEDAPERIIRSNCWAIAGALFPGALVADRTALEHRPAEDGSVFLVTDRRSRDVVLPGLTFRPRRGHAPVDGHDLPFMGGLWMSSQARALLDNLRPTRRRGRVRATCSRAELEEFLEKVLRQGGADTLNRLRDQARAIAPALGMEARAAELDALIGSLQGTREAPLETGAGRARARGDGFDPERLELFESLRAALAVHPFPERRARAGNAYLPFFESYFSNFIEGTEFEVGEAYDIVYRGRVPAARPEDAHDILGTFRLVSDTREMSAAATDGEGFLELLRRRHATIMGGRRDKLPGQFKSEGNRAGESVFVRPELVAGTLRRGFGLLASLAQPLARAIYAMFLVAEVHPFADGNGRVARAMMNVELCRAGLERIVVPTGYRTEYLQSLRALTHNGRPAALISVMDFAQRFTAAVDFSDYGQALRQLERCHAFAPPADAMGGGGKLVLPEA